MLKFKTKEKWVINPQSGTTYQQFKEMEIRRQNFSEKTTISQKFPVSRFSGSTGPGQLSFPFTLEIPVNVPGTCNIDDNVSISSIQSLLIAYVTSIEGTVKKFHLPLVIIEPFSSPLSSEGTFAVSTGCCGCRGRVTMYIEVDRNAYKPGEEIEISVEIDNSGNSVPIRAVTVGLYRIVDVVLEDGRITYIRRSTHKEMVMRKVIPAGQALMAERRLRLKLPIDINPTTVSAKGRIMKCFYTIDVCPEISKGWIWGSRNQILSHRVAIQPFEPMFLVPPAIPEAWNPEVLPFTLLSLRDTFHAAS